MSREKLSEKSRILIYGHEIGGQMQLLAEGLRSRGFIATSAAVNEDFRRFRCDVHVLPEAGRAKKEFARWMFAFFAMANYDVFHFFWGVSLLAFWRLHRLDLPLLKAMGKRVVVHFRGLDLVDVKVFDQTRESVKRLRNGDTPIVRLKSRATQRRALRQWRRWADVMLVSEPDLFDLVPEAVLSPQVVDVAQWPTREGRPIGEKLRVVHAPTNRRKKGTEFVIAACEELVRRGLPLELVLVEGRPYGEVLELYRTADIAVDQVLYGWYGKFSVETMCMGIPTVCFIREDLLRFRPDLPIVNATPLTLVQTLEKLSRDAAWRLELAHRGSEYVRRHHSLEVILDQLETIYGFHGGVLGGGQAEGRL